MVWRITYLPLITQLWVGEDIYLVSHSGWLGADGPDCTWADAVGRWSFFSSLENTFGQFTFLNKNVSLLLFSLRILIDIYSVPLIWRPCMKYSIWVTSVNLQHVQVFSMFYRWRNWDFIATFCLLNNLISWLIICLIWMALLSLFQGDFIHYFSSSLT